MFKKVFVLLGILHLGCDAVSTDNIPNDILTVEAEIEANTFANVKLTNSLPFRGVIDSLDIAMAVEGKAKVELFDGQDGEVLTLKRNEDNFPFFFYRSNRIKGEVGKTYDLKITIRGKEFRATTEVPSQPIVENIGFVDGIDDDFEGKSFKRIRLVLNNDVNTNTVRYFKVLIRNQGASLFEFADPFIFSTENIGTATFPLILSFSQFIDGENENQLYVGNTVELKLVAITKDQFEFWKSVRGDVTVPIDNASFTNNVISNVDNGAFGYWSGENALSFLVEIP